MPDILIACEASGDARVAKGLAERVLHTKIAWFEDLAIEARPVWGGFLQGTDFLRWASIKKIYKAVEDEKPTRVPAVLGRFRDGIPPKLEAVNALKVLRLAELSSAFAVVLMRDVDAHSQSDLQTGLEHGKDEYLRTRISKARKAVGVVIGTPDRYREAWLLAGFIPQNKTEQTRVDTELKTLAGIHPIQEPHRLRDAPNNPRCAKDIWGRLSDSSEAREMACWSAPSLETLHQNGKDCGLSDFLHQVQTHLLPAVMLRQN